MCSVLQVAGKGEPCTRPAEQGSQAEEQGRIGQGQDVQRKLDAIEGSQFGDWSAQQQGSDEDSAPGHQSAGQALQGAEIIERAPDEGIGRAEQS